jgi:hypothetical protein
MHTAVGRGALGGAGEKQAVRSGVLNLGANLISAHPTAAGFSAGLNPEILTLMIFFKISNQKGAPWAVARLVTINPIIFSTQPNPSDGIGMLVNG